MKEFIGIFYICSALKGNIHNSNQIWYHESSNDLSATTASLERFYFLTRSIEFANASRERRWQFEKFACIRDFFETVNENNVSMKGPSSYWALDETLYPYLGSIGIKQHNTNKMAKYRLLHCSFCDVVVPYMYYTLPYARKPSETNNEAYPKYYIWRTDKYIRYLVHGLNHYNFQR